MGLLAWEKNQLELYWSWCSSPSLISTVIASHPTGASTCLHSICIHDACTCLLKSSPAYKVVALPVIILNYISICFQKNFTIPILHVLARAPLSPALTKSKTATARIQRRLSLTLHLFFPNFGGLRTGSREADLPDGGDGGRAVVRVLAMEKAARLGQDRRGREEEGGCRGRGRVSQELHGYDRPRSSDETLPRRGGTMGGDGEGSRALPTARRFPLLGRRMVIGLR